MSQAKKAQTSNPRIKIRPATLKDVDALVALNKRAYPTMAEDNVVWRREHIESHLRVFPEGQLVAFLGKQVVGMASTLIVSLGQDPYRDHTYNGITDSGYFTNHTSDGDTLYGADISVDPEHRNLGIGAKLYQARRKLCESLNLRRIVLGGRLYGYSKHSKKMGAEEYARKVESGDLKDLVLSFQLKQGFVLRKVMANYLTDRKSLDFASFLEWINPEYKPVVRKQRSVRVSCVQYKMRKISGFSGFEQQVRYFFEVAADYKSDFVVYPEFLTTQLISFLSVRTPQEAIRKLTDYTTKVDALFSRLAKRHQLTAIGGSHPIREGKKIYNVASMYLPDGTIHRQPKLHITPAERTWWGIEGGSTLQVFETPKAKVGILICYDSEFPEAARYLVDQGADIIFVPFCTDDRQAYLRVRYCCQARAVENQVYIAMAGNVGNLPEVANMDVQYAQSAVLTPSDFAFARDGILVEATPNAETVITSDVNLDALQQAIAAGSVRQRIDRRPDLFKYSVSLKPKHSD